jgi:predicted porin
MKKLLLATAIAALSVSAAQAAPTVYGKAFMTLDYVNTDKNTVNGTEESDSLQVNSNASRIGFKGSEAITANTDVIYQLEYGIDIDNDAADNFKNRDTYLGLNNKTYGQFRFGHNHSPADYIDNVLITNGDAYFDNLGTFMADSKRIKNSVLWLAPKYQGLPLKMTAMYVSDEDNIKKRNSEGFGASAMFDQGTGFTAGVAYENDVNIEEGGDVLRGSATVDLGKYMAAPVTLGALYQVADYDATAEDEKGLLVSAKMGLTNFAKPVTVFAQYNNTSDKGGVKDVDADQIVVGGKYYYKPNIIANAYTGMNSIDNIANVEKDVIASTSVRGNGETETFVVGGGLEYRF